MYNVFLPMLPVVLVRFYGYLTSKSKKLFTIIRDGQLCFYCTAAMTSLLKDLADKQTLNGLMMSFIICLIIFSTFVYGAAVTTEKNDDNEKKFGKTSLLTWLLTVILVLFVRNKEKLF